MRLTTGEVAELLGTTPAAVHKLVQARKLKAVRQGRGRPVLYDRESVEQERRRREEART